MQDDDGEIQIYVPENKGAPSGDQSEPTKETEPKEQAVTSSEKSIEDVTNQNELANDSVSGTPVVTETQDEDKSPSGEMTLTEDIDATLSEVVNPACAEDVDSKTQPMSNGDNFCLTSEQDFHAEDEFQPATEKGECQVAVGGI